MLTNAVRCTCTNCNRKSFYINCPNNERNIHNSFDRKCPTFISHKEELVRQEVYNITRTLYNRHPSSNKAQYSEIVKKNNEVSQVVQDMKKFKDISESHLSELDRKFEESIELEQIFQ